MDLQDLLGAGVVSQSSLSHTLKPFLQLQPFCWLGGHTHEGPQLSLRGEKSRLGRGAGRGFLAHTIRVMLATTQFLSYQVSLTGPSSIASKPISFFLD